MGNITTTPPTVQQAYEEDECRLMVWLVADTLTGPVVTPKLVAFTINKPATSPTLTLVPLWVFLSTTKIQSGFSLSALDNSDRLVTRHLSGMAHFSPNHFFFYLAPISCWNLAALPPPPLLSLGSLWICWTSGQNVPPRHTNKRPVPSCSEAKQLGGSLSEHGSAGLW